MEQDNLPDLMDEFENVTDQLCSYHMKKLSRRLTTSQLEHLHELETYVTDLRQKIDEKLGVTNPSQC